MEKLKHHLYYLPPPPLSPPYTSPSHQVKASEGLQKLYVNVINVICLVFGLFHIDFLHELMDHERCKINDLGHAGSRSLNIFIMQS